MNLASKDCFGCKQREVNQQGSEVRVSAFTKSVPEPNFFIFLRSLLANNAVLFVCAKQKIVYK